MRLFACFLLVFATWAVVTWGAQGGYGWDPQDLIAGLFFSILVAAFLSDIYPTMSVQVLNPRRWLWAAVYLPYFAVQCVKANLDVAYRVLHPEMPIRPGIVKVTTGLKKDISKTFLANSITLTPGTMSVDIDGQDLYIHWINVSTMDPGEQTRTIVGWFERIIKEIFE